MKLPINPIHVFYAYQKKHHYPALLESHGPRTHYCQRSVLGTKIRKSIIAKQGILYSNDKPVASSQDIFQFLSLPSSKQFFPAWIGFFSYEFAQNFDLPTKEPLADFPEAAFFLYEEGYRWENNVLVEQPAQPISIDSELSYEIPTVTLHCDFPKEKFLQAVEEVKERIWAGDVYQVNLAQRFHFDKRNLDSLSLYIHLTKSNPSPFMGLIIQPDWSIISGSPERLFSYNQGQILTRPIAGTRPRGETILKDSELELELYQNRKERAEHTMLVDLLRNDLAKVSLPGSIHVSEAFTIEHYSHVMHLVSEVKGMSTASLRSLTKAIFPGGTITGTPKESAMQCIADLEPVARGGYTGSMGYISSGCGTDFNILIRSLFLGKEYGFFSTGAGIVAESDPKKEYEEIEQKALSLRHILKCGNQGHLPKTPKTSSNWKPKLSKKQFDTTIAFVENHDSFSFNIIDYFRMLGCEVFVFDHQQNPDLKQCTHVILGPGPGEPHSSGQLMNWLLKSLEKNIPLLGICLGHQAIGLAFGAKLVHAYRPIHGETESIVHCHQGLFKNIDLDLKATRYHSLVLKDLPYELEGHAYSQDGQIMAIAHRTKPIYGIQFHPESFLSTQGILLLQNFLAHT